MLLLFLLFGTWRCPLFASECCRICDTTFNEIFPLHLAHHHATFQLQSLADLLQHMLQKPPTAKQQQTFVGELASDRQRCDSSREFGVLSLEFGGMEYGFLCDCRLRLRFDEEAGEHHQRQMHLLLRLSRILLHLGIPAGCICCFCFCFCLCHCMHIEFQLGLAEWRKLNCQGSLVLFPLQHLQLLDVFC